MTASPEFNSTIKAGSGKAERRVQYVGEQKQWTIDFTDLMPVGAAFALAYPIIWLDTGVTQYATAVISGNTVVLSLDTSGASNGVDYEVYVQVGVYHNGSILGAPVQEALGAGFVLACRSNP